MEWVLECHKYACKWWACWSSGHFMILNWERHVFDRINTTRLTPWGGNCLRVWTPFECKDHLLGVAASLLSANGTTAFMKAMAKHIYNIIKHQTSSIFDWYELHMESICVPLELNFIWSTIEFYMNVIYVNLQKFHLNFEWKSLLHNHKWNPCQWAQHNFVWNGLCLFLYLVIKYIFEAGQFLKFWYHYIF